MIMNMVYKGGSILWRGWLVHGREEIPRSASQTQTFVGLSKRGYFYNKYKSSMFRLTNTTTSRCLVHARQYATKSKTTNLKFKTAVPTTETTLADGSIFIAREAPVPVSIQAKAAPLTAPYEKQYNLTEQQMEEMRQLRREDPQTWTRKKLAEKFNCSQLFVAISAPLPPSAQSNETVASKDGYRRKLIKENRQKRRELW